MLNWQEKHRWFTSKPFVCVTLRSGEHCGYECACFKTAQTSRTIDSELKQVIHCVSCYDFLLLFHKGHQLRRRVFSVGHAWIQTAEWMRLHVASTVTERGLSYRISNSQYQLNAFKPVFNAAQLRSDHSGQTLILHLSQAWLSTRPCHTNLPRNGYR